MRPVSGAGVEENAESFIIVGAGWRAGIEWVGVNGEGSEWMGVGWVVSEQECMGVGSEWGWTVSTLGGGLSPTLSDSRGCTLCAVL